MEFKLAYNELRTDRKVAIEGKETDQKENFVRVEVFNANDIYTPSLIKVTHGYNKLEDWPRRWIFSSLIRESAIRHAIQILDEYVLGQLCSVMADWNTD